MIWQSYGQDGDGYGIYGQIFNADGTKSGSEFPVNTYTTNYQQLPSVASLSAGKFVVTWQSTDQDGSGYGVYGQIFNSDGTKSGIEFQINTYTINGQMRSSVASLSTGKFVVAWQSDGDGWGVYGQLFNADRTKNGSEFPVNTYTTGAQVIPSVSSLNNGKFVVTWSSNGQDGDGWGIYGQIFNADGTKSGTEFQANTYTVNDQWGAAVASLNNNSFVVTWMSDGQDGDQEGVYGQIFNADGTKSSSEFQVNTYIINTQSYPSVANLNKDKFVVTWTSNGQDGDLYGVYGQIFRLPSITTSSTTSSRTSSSSSSSLTFSSSKRSSSSSSSKSSSSSSSSKSSSSRLSTRSDSASTVSTIDVSTKETKATIKDASISNASSSITSVATKNMFTIKNSSNSTKRTWIISAIIGSLIIIPASILAFLKLKKNKSQNPSTIEMQNNDPENALQVLPQIDPSPSSQHLSQNAIDQTGESDEEPTYMDLSQFPGQRDDT